VLNIVSPKHTNHIFYRNAVIDKDILPRMFSIFLIYLAFLLFLHILHFQAKLVSQRRHLTINQDEIQTFEAKRVLESDWTENRNASKAKNESLLPVYGWIQIEYARTITGFCNEKAQ
jgi:hypothetical protein